MTQFHLTGSTEGNQHDNSFVTNAPILALVTGPTDYAVVSELHLMNVNSNYGGNIAVAISVGSDIGTYRKPNLSSIARDNNGDNCLLPGLFIVNEWLVPPTAPSTFFRRAQLGYATAEAIYWPFYRGLKLAPSNALIIWSKGATPGSGIGSCAILEFDFGVDA